MQIRNLNKTDFPSVKDIIISLFREVFILNKIVEPENAVELAIKKESSLEDFIDDGTAIALAAFIDGSIVGLAWLYKYEFACSSRLHLTEIVVAEEFRGHGIGSLLLDNAEEYARNIGIDKIDLYVSCNNSQVRSFYEKLGFKKTRIHMVKDLGNK